MSSSPPKPWLIIRFRAPIRSTKPQLPEAEIRQAIAPDYPLTPIQDVDLIEAGWRYGDWDHARALMDVRLDAIGDLMERADVEHIGVFAFGPIPLLAYLGYRLNNKDGRIRLFQRHRDTASWVWKADTGEMDRYSQPDCVVDVPGSKDVAIAISVSDTVDTALIQETMAPATPTIYSLMAPAIGRRVLSREEQLGAFCAAYEGFLDRYLNKRHGADAQLHVFAAVPIPVAIELGRTPHADGRGALHVYEWSRGEYTCGLNLFAPRGTAPVSADTALQHIEVAGEHSTADYIPIEALPDLVFKKIPAGESSVGGLEIEGLPPSPRRRVSVDSFFMSETPITQAQWEYVRELGDARLPENPARFKGDLKRPVECVTWFHAVTFANALSRLAGLEPAYTEEGDEWRVGHGLGFRLPLEWEWEYACTRGEESDEELQVDAWMAENSDAQTQAVRERPANAAGLYDMLGNVWEWCEDRWSDEPEADTSAALRVDEATARYRDAEGLRAWPPSEHRVVRGGSWNSEAWLVHPKVRLKGRAAEGNAGRGFRLVLRRPPNASTRPLPPLQAHQRVPVGQPASVEATGHMHNLNISGGIVQINYNPQNPVLDARTLLKGAGTKED